MSTTPARVVAYLAACVLLAAAALAFPAQVPDVSAVLQDKVKQGQDLATGLLTTVSKNLNSHQEHAILDLNLPGKKVYDYIQTTLVNVLRPQPIIDTIREEDKYGNDGERFAKVGRKVVGGVETITNLLATAVDAPFTALKSLTRKASESLNNLGSKLIGL